MPHAFYAEQRRRGASDADIFTMGIQEEPWQHLANFTTKAEDVAPPFAFQDYYTPALGGQGGAVARLSRYETVSELCSGFLRRLNVSAFDRLYRAAAYPSISPRRPSGRTWLRPSAILDTKPFTMWSTLRPSLRTSSLVA